MTCCARCELQEELHRIRRSALLAAGGVAVYEGLIGPADRARLLNEALEGPRHLYAAVGHVDRERIRGGTPARQFIGVDGGPLQDAFFLSRELSGFIAGQLNARVRPHGQRASYTIYAGEGAFLDIHRDVVGCDITLITCLHDNDKGANGGALDCWPSDLTTPLDEIREQPERGRVRLPHSPGESILIQGGVIPHRTPRTAPGRLRVVSLMCFEML